MDTIPLCALSPGKSGIIHQLNMVGQMRRRLLDLGLTPGTPINCVGCSPGGDPAAYRIRQAIIAIRRADALAIRIQPIEEEMLYGTDQNSCGSRSDG